MIYWPMLDLGRTKRTPPCSVPEKGSGPVFAHQTLFEDQRSVPARRDYLQTAAALGLDGPAETLTATQRGRLADLDATRREGVGSGRRPT
jgi:hypothetical protein